MLEDRDWGFALPFVDIEDELEPAGIGGRRLRRVVSDRIPASGSPVPATVREGEREDWRSSGTALPYLGLPVWARESQMRGGKRHRCNVHRAERERER